MYRLIKAICLPLGLCVSATFGWAQEAVPGNLATGSVGGTEVAVAKAPSVAQRNQQLSQTPWSLSELNGGKASPNPTGKAPYVRFAKGGQLLGFAGCNVFKGRYTLEGDRLLITKLDASRKSCSGDSRQEKAFLANLVLANNLQLENDQLSLSMSGRVLLRLKAAPALNQAEVEAVNPATIGKYPKGTTSSVRATDKTRSAKSGKGSVDEHKAVSKTEKGKKGADKGSSKSSSVQSKSSAKTTHATPSRNTASKPVASHKASGKVADKPVKKAEEHKSTAKHR